MLFSTAGTAGKARLTIAPDGPPGEGSGLQEHIRGETGGRRGPAGRHRAASGGPRRGSGRGRRQGEPERQAVSPTACRSGPPGPGLPIKKERLVLQQTSNYQLSQWDAEDRIQREDFNSDNAKVDAALKNQASDLAALQQECTKLGNCKVVYGSYTGTGTYNSGNANTLNFDHKPLLLAIMPEVNTGNAARGFLAVRNSAFTYTYPGNFNSINTVTWTDRGVSWYCAYSAAYQFNSSGVYHYAALLAAEE